MKYQQPEHMESLNRIVSFLFASGDQLVVVISKVAVTVFK